MRAGALRIAARPHAAEAAFDWFRRIVALFCLAMGIFYWVRLIGIYDGPLWRYDLMPVPWRLASVTLAVFFPFAGIGLWMLASWGPVIWVICAGTEAVMHLGFPEIFGRGLGILLLHGLVALLYCGLVAVISWQRRQDDVSRN